MYRKFLGIIFFLSSVLCFGQTIESQDTIFVVDTVVIYDTVSISKKKIEPISLPNTDSTLATVNKKTKKHIPYNFGFHTADYTHLGGYYRLKFNKIFGLIGLGYNFHKEAPLNLALGIGYRFSINEKIKFQPNLYSILYMPLKLNFGSSNTNHLRLGLNYSISKRLSINMEPSCFFSIIKGDNYNETILAYTSCIKPLSNNKLQSGDRFIWGLGLSLGIEFSAN